MESNPSQDNSALDSSVAEAINNSTSILENKAYERIEDGIYDYGHKIFQLEGLSSAFHEFLIETLDPDIQSSKFDLVEQLNRILREKWADLHNQKDSGSRNLVSLAEEQEAFKNSENSDFYDQNFDLVIQQQYLNDLQNSMDQVLVLINRQKDLYDERSENPSQNPIIERNRSTKKLLEKEESQMSPGSHSRLGLRADQIQNLIRVENSKEHTPEGRIWEKTGLREVEGLRAEIGGMSNIFSSVEGQMKSLGERLDLITQEQNGKESAATSELLQEIKNLLTEIKSTKEKDVKKN